MTPERWNRIATIFDAALAIDPQKRSTFLADACAGDEALRREVERLLAEDERTPGFLDRQLVETGAANEPRSGGDSATRGSALNGRLIQHRFAVRAKLGAGGMGEVYLADDTKLKRCVALKRLPAKMRLDDRYRKRLLQEARRASSVSDPHIAQVYDILEEDEETFLVMEYIEGTTLRQRINSPLPVGEFLDMAVQCAGALAAAHQKGVVHCDIKPENIMITGTGQVKILDFGIAKRLPVYDDVTTTDGVELQGLVGTPAYMAPEVLAGHHPDAMADIYSLGVTFYEALTGHRPTPASFSLIAATGEQTADGPAALQAIELTVKKMLQPDPAQRYSNAVDLLRDLRSLQDSESLELNPRRVRTGLVSRRGALAVSILLLVVVAWVAVTRMWPWIYRALHPVSASVLAEKDTVVLADFTNKTGDPVFDETLKQALTVALRESPFLNVLSDDHVVAMRKRPVNPSSGIEGPAR